MADPNRPRDLADYSTVAVYGNFNILLTRLPTREFFEGIGVVVAVFRVVRPPVAAIKAVEAEVAYIGCREVHYRRESLGLDEVFDAGAKFPRGSR